MAALHLSNLISISEQEFPPEIIRDDESSGSDAGRHVREATPRRCHCLVNPLDNGTHAVGRRILNSIDWLSRRAVESVDVYVNEEKLFMDGKVIIYSNEISDSYLSIPNYKSRHFHRARMS